MPETQFHATAEQEDWQQWLTCAIAAEIRRHRIGHKMSAQKLADRCEQLGFAVPRSVLTNLENGHREALSIAELLVIAAALGVPPARLLPDEHVPSWDGTTGRPRLTAQQKEDARKLLAEGGCEYCSGIHAAQGVACPRVKSFSRDGTMVSAVRYWPHGKWPTDSILWPEDVAEDDGDEEEGTL